jgi:hypothetical protein
MSGDRSRCRRTSRSIEITPRSAPFVDQDAARLHVTLSGAPFAPQRNTFPGSVFGDTVTFDPGYPFYYYSGAPVEELLPNAHRIGICITARAAPQSISGTLVGAFMYERPPLPSASCGGNDNQIVFTRQ